MLGKHGAVEKPPLLLLVEDAPIVASLAQPAFEDGDYAVRLATDGHAAKAIIDDLAPELAGLITDVELGGGTTGWDVARHAREVRPDLPVVYMTGGGSQEWASHGVPNSVLVNKPFAPAQLVTAMSTLLNRTDNTP